MTECPRFVSDRQGLDDLLDRTPLIACPRCHQTGALIGHGMLKGYAERGTGGEVRGRRLLCSVRNRRAGCGRTCSVLLATVIPGFTVRTLTLSMVLTLVIDGMSRKAAWERAEAEQGRGLTLRSAYRLWARLEAGQSHLRTALCGLVPPHDMDDPRPMAQLWHHLQRAAEGAKDLLAALQVRVQQPVFG